MNRNLLKTPTGRRQTSWLFTKRAGVEFGATEDKSIQWQGGGGALTTRPRSPPQILINLSKNIKYIPIK